jgi:hypothetical protein
VKAAPLGDFVNILPDGVMVRNDRDAPFRGVAGDGRAGYAFYT